MVREKIATAPAEVKRDGFGIDDVLSQMGQRGARQNRDRGHLAW
jgi:hypothetical protein